MQQKTHRRRIRPAKQAQALLKQPAAAHEGGAGGDLHGLREGIEELRLGGTRGMALPVRTLHRRDEGGRRITRREEPQEMPVTCADIAELGMCADEGRRKRFPGGELLVKMLCRQRGIGIPHGPAPAEHGAETGRDQLLRQRAHLAVGGILPGAAAGEEDERRVGARQLLRNVERGGVCPPALAVLEHENGLAILSMVRVPGQVEHVEVARAVVLHQLAELFQATAFLDEIQRAALGGFEDDGFLMLVVEHGCTFSGLEAMNSACSGRFCGTGLPPATFRQRTGSTEGLSAWSKNVVPSCKTSHGRCASRYGMAIASTSTGA
jgi:hypothetical protein